MCVEQAAAFARALVRFVRDLPAAPAAQATLGTDERFVQGMRIRRAVLGDAHVDLAEARKTAFDEPFQATWTRPFLPIAISPPRIVPAAIAVPGSLLTRSGEDHVAPKSDDFT